MLPAENFTLLKQAWLGSEQEPAYRALYRAYVDSTYSFTLSFSGYSGKGHNFYCTFARTCCATAPYYRACACPQSRPLRLSVDFPYNAFKIQNVPLSLLYSAEDESKLEERVALWFTATRKNALEVPVQAYFTAQTMLTLWHDFLHEDSNQYKTVVA